MSKQRRCGIGYARAVRGVCGALVLLSSWGCGVTIDAGGGSGTTDGNRDMALSSPFGKTSGEPNGSFDDPIVAVFDASGVARLQGTVSVPGDLDVFYLGRLDAGDQIVVDVATSGSVLDSSVALFDELGRLLYANDDRGGAPNRFLDSLIDFTVRRASDEYFLVVTSASFADSGDRTGSYIVDITVTSGFDVPPPTPQILLLNFEGGRITVPELGPITLAPFDAGSIRDPGSLFAPYDGQTQVLKDSIRQTVEQNFERFRVEIITSDDPLPVGTEYSTVHFGGFHLMAFGEAQAVDIYNADFCDDAIIYAESFVPRVFSTLPSTQALGVAIGNVASHEAGHLLGLNHVNDDQALMDDRSSADVFLLDQEFKNSPLSGDIMVIGTQDAVLLLDETVGPFPF
ncbi:MAG: matrixin family metalloprotease [Planctomycetes bacterium]|nr:matrixin family metalloprotease [Planctomycetota bacterium]